VRSGSVQAARCRRGTPPGRSVGDAVSSADVRELDITPCTGELHCWFKVPGVCCIRDDMKDLCPQLRAAETPILARPVDVLPPGEFQNPMNCLCPLVSQDTYRRRLNREDVKPKRNA